jgi:hypothetical protein
MKRREVVTLLNRSNSHNLYIEGVAMGVTKFQVFLAIKPLLKDKLYWFALGDAYTSSDNLYCYKADVKQAFTCDEVERDYLMNKSERQYLKNLPEQITIYRGMTENELKQKSFGCSWTLKKEVADYFANTYQRNFATKHLKKVVHSMTINKSEVIAFFNGRDEFEIIYIQGK